MVYTRSDKSIVKIWDSANKKWKELTCGKLKVERKQDMNTRTACNSKQPYEVNPGDEEWTVEIPDLSVEHEGYFMWIMNRQVSTVPLDISVVEFRYDRKGKLIRQYLLQQVYFESMSQEGNETFEVKGGALSCQR